MDDLHLGLIHPSLLLGPIAEPQVPPDCPEHSDGPEDDKDIAPAELTLQGHHDQGCNRAAQSAGHPDDRLSPSSLHEGEPAGDGTRAVRMRAGLPGTEQEPGDPESLDAAHPPGESGEDRPSDHDAREGPAGSKTVAKPPAGNLEDPVSERKSAEDTAHLQCG